MSSSEEDDKADDKDGNRHHNGKQAKTDGLDDRGGSADIQCVRLGLVDNEAHAGIGRAGEVLNEVQRIALIAEGGVAEEGADKKQIEESIKTMKNYFDEYDTTVNFISEEEFDAVHNKMPHGGFVIRTGETGCEGNKHVIEYSLKLESNPEFTSSVLVAYARALSRMKAEGMTGCKTVFDVAPAYLSPLSADEIRAHLL